MPLWEVVFIVISSVAVLICLPIIWVMLKNPSQDSWIYKLAHKLTIIIGSILAHILYKVLNRTQVYGNLDDFKKVTQTQGVVVCSNHLSAWDSFCLGVVLFRGLVRHPSHAPVHSPKYRPELSSGASRTLLKLFKCVFIDVENPRQVINEWKPQILEYLQTGASTILFGEGTRHTGPDYSVLQPWKQADGLLISGTSTTCIPVAVRGTEEVLPKGAVVPRIGKRIVIVVGEPITFDDTAKRKDISTTVGAAVQVQLTRASTLHAILNPSPILRLLQYCWVGLSGVACWIFFHIFNQTIVIGKNRLNHRRNTLIVPSHGTMIDSWLIESQMIWPEFLTKPWLMTTHTPELENYGRNPLLRLMCLLSNVIYIKRGNRGQDFDEKLPAIKASLLAGQLMMFHDGGRNKEIDQNPKLRRKFPVTGIKILIDQQRPDWIIPVAVIGMQSVLKPHTRRLRIGKLVVMIIGEPIETRQYDNALLIQKITDQINQLLCEADERHRAAMYTNPFRRLIEFVSIRLT